MSADAAGACLSFLAYGFSPITPRAEISVASGFMAMPMIQPCPSCGEPSPWVLAEVKWDAHYYRCPVCGTVWNRPKNVPEPIKIIVLPFDRHWSS